MNNVAAGEFETWEGVGLWSRITTFQNKQCQTNPSGNGYLPL